MKIAQTLYKVFNWLFIIGVVLQVFFAGMVVVAGQMDWAAHRDTGHIIGLAVILMAILMYVGKAGRQVKRTTWILLLVYILQADVLIFMRQSVPLASAFHPVLALIDFWLAVKLLRMPWEA
jgi:heme A synthase